MFHSLLIPLNGVLYLITCQEVTVAALVSDTASPGTHQMRPVFELNIYLQCRHFARRKLPRNFGESTQFNPEIILNNSSVRNRNVRAGVRLHVLAYPY